MPPPRTLLDAAVDLTRTVLRGEHAADAEVSHFFRQHRQLGQRDRHALAETVYEILRRRPQWQHLAQSGSGPLERRLCILAWRGDGRLLAPALSPAEVRWRDEVLAIDPASLPESVRHQLPAWLAERLRAERGEADFGPLVAALAEPAPLDLRVNALKSRRDDARQALAEAGLEASPTPLSPWGLRLQEKPALARLPVFQQGLIEVQDEGSQLLAALTGATRGEMVVDFCAGAGGKTLALGAMMRNTGRLYAFDVAAHRLEALKPRLARSGLSNVHPVAIAHERDDRIKRLAGKIDRVLVDAPCSGLGTLRRNPDLKWRQSAAAVAEMAVRQLAILRSAARLLRPGGRLVYATCSLLRAENEAIAQAFDAEEAARFEVLPVAGLLASLGVADPAAAADGPYLRLWPHRHHTDGFFAAVWQRR